MLPNGEPVRPCSRKSHGCASSSTLSSRPRQLGIIAGGGAMRTKGSSRPD
ncbi:MAG: hypothetical protein IT426_00810 [Pirellulales bacterium]|nr:hypothetical protein [Pirellulales bacterium]